MSSPNTPCAACKLQRRKCTQECVFAPYFPPDLPQKFANLHKVFGASNVAKLLNELNASQREVAVNTLAYEAEARLQNPIYGCVGLISLLQHNLRQLQTEIINAKKELATYIGPQACQAMLPINIQPQGFIPQQQMHAGNPSSSAAVLPYNMSPMLGIPTGGPTHGGQLVIREPQSTQHQHHQQQIFEAQQLAAREQQEILRTYEQQQPELVRFNSGFDPAVTASGFNQMNDGGGGVMSPSLGLGNFENSYQMQPQQGEHHGHPLHHALQAQLLLQPVQQQAQSESEEGRGVGPSC
ncbi:LOB domain-containing protein 36-like [Corylus avellana]|uniref:LOB domain-containing protein 36-like n=1 Tax=Corylus avellana TaxID=13451 RepID=UPI001E20C95F|nr:LOB domain-containing protein 36-like [Corylus avellana]